MSESMNRTIGYGFGAAGASLFYVVWLVTTTPPEIDAGLRIRWALFFWLINGFCLTLVLMGALWILAVRLYPRWRWVGWVYYVSIGTVLMLVIGCATASLSPKPTFEDQTFLEGVRAVAESQGICLGLAGMIHGFVYWFVCEKRLCSRGRNTISCNS